MPSDPRPVSDPLQPLLQQDLPALAERHPHWGRLYGASRALALAELARRARRLVVVLAPDTHSADQLEQELRFFLGQKAHIVQHLPDWETLPYDLFSPHEDIVSERLRVLAGLATRRQGLLVVPVSTFLQRIAPASYLAAHAFDLRAGQRLDVDAFRQRLERAGYRAVSQVYTHGEFAVRGAIVDVFPMGSTAPFRIDLFDDEIDSLRRFDPETQRSTERIEQVQLLPAREFPLDEAGIRRFRRRYRERFEGDPNASAIYRSVSAGSPVGGIEYYLPLFFEETATLLDYLPADCLFVQLEDSADQAETFYRSVEARYEQRRHDIERPLLRPDEICLPPQEAFAALAGRPGLTLHCAELPPAPGHLNFATAALPDLSLKPRQAQPAAALQQWLAGQGGRKVVFCADSAGRRESLLDTLHPFDLRPRSRPDWHACLADDAPLVITVAPLAEGFVLPADGVAVVPEGALLPQHARQARRRRRPTRDADAIVRNLTDLHIGAPVVHEDHGVGRYRGLQRLDVGGGEAEYLTLEYAGGDKLYVPVSSLHLISRYTGADAEHAPLHKLGSGQWERARRKAARKARDVAAELLEIYARRAARSGHAFPFDPQEYEAFASAFPFEETEDQQAAIDAVLKDLASERPTDRVICGDVGFGKTEVAMRAAFVVASTGRQVAVLVPTTLLAQQHGQNFADRFADWPIRVEALSRFQSPRQQKAILQDLAEGKVDIIIGTHKLLQKDVKFKNLGLVIIDEEQRFGVRHKEHLKSLRAEVDVLTLTATPIPRTLNFSLAGLRDLSIIATPPLQRHAIKTFVTEWNAVLIQEAIQREIRRGGQVYFLHNEVKTIDKAARELAELVPEADIRVAHGQMREHDLEQVMLDFVHQRFQVLVCTTIIETGIDVPSANTIIIQRADRFGLAQLHQLRGRVGRSHHRAYAYLITPPRKAMTPDAIKRLEAIESLEDLGVGFTLATHDLEIRGAGELLGDEQSGQIQEIGFTLYNQLLERAVQALKSGQVPEDLDSARAATEVDLGRPALLPEDYVPDVHERLILYKRIASAASEAELHELQVELVDRFGLLPEPARALFDNARIKLLAQPLGIRKLDLAGDSGRILFHREPSIDVGRLLAHIQRRPDKYRLDGQEKLRFTLDPEEQKRPLEWLQDFLRDIGADRAAA